jgi:hypothetical protein
LATTTSPVIFAASRIVIRLLINRDMISIAAYIYGGILFRALSYLLITQLAPMIVPFMKS